MPAGILSLDLGTTTGWAFADAAALKAWPAGPFVPGKFRPEIICGAEKFKADTLGPFFSEAATWLRDTIAVFAPAAIVFEAPIPHHKSIGASRKLFGLATLVEMVAFDCGVRQVREEANNRVKKHFAGNGRAEKEAVDAACRARGWNPVDFNCADACGLLEVSVRQLVHKEAL